MLSLKDYGSHFLINKTLCTLHYLLERRILPADIMEPTRVFDDFSLKSIFRNK
jgi:hypothetical protein